MFDSADIGLWLVTSVLHLFLYTGIIFPILRIVENSPSENIRFIRIARGSPSSFMNCLDSLFVMPEGPRAFIVFKVFYVRLHVLCALYYLIYISHFWSILFANINYFFNYLPYFV